MSLVGKSVVITRQCSGSSELSNIIERYGANTLSFPLISTTSVEPIALKESMKNWDENTWVIITSQNALPSFYKFYQELFCDGRQPFKIATVGDKTKYYIEKLGFKVSFVPSSFTAKSLLKELTPILTDEKVVYLRGSLAKEEIFQKSFANYESFVLYETKKEEANAQKLLTTLRKIGVDFITFTSPSAVHCFFENSDVSSAIKEISYVAIGPSTKQALENYIAASIIMPKQYTLEGMVSAMNECGGK